jgi:two-component system OmpR family sensor kinase
MIRLPAMPLFLQALGLVIATLVAAQIATIVVILSLPPPAPQVYTVADVVGAVEGDMATPAREGRPLMAEVSTAPPLGETFGRRRTSFRNAVASALNVNPTQVMVSQLAPRLIVLTAPPPRRPHTVAAETIDSEQPLLFGSFQLGVKQPDGRWLIIKPKTAFGIDPWQQRVLLVLLLAAVVVSPLAWWFARRMAAPITALAAGAERLGRDPQAPPLNIRGSAEVTAAVGAFNEMQDRLRRYVEYRTTMIGAIAHDLRTPLTRLRFRIEAVPEDLRLKLANDIDEMEAMVAATMSFVRDAAVPRQRQKLEIASLVETVMDEAAETGSDTAVDRADRVVVDGDSLALKRLLINLVENALKFGSLARARVFSDGTMAIVEIDDNGPGIAEEHMEEAFEPFHRLEASRSRDTGGIGLGLAVVRAIARGHGGDVCLNNRTGGGLRARLSLPLAAGG